MERIKPDVIVEEVCISNYAYDRLFINHPIQLFNLKKLSREDKQDLINWIDNCTNEELVINILNIKNKFKKP